MRTSLQHDRRLGHLARPLAHGVHNMRDPFARRLVLSQAGFVGISDRDSFRAGELAQARRAIMVGTTFLVPTLVVPAQPGPSLEDLIERMAVSLVCAVRAYDLDLDESFAVERALVDAGFTELDASRPDVVALAVARARTKLKRAALIDCAGDTAALGSLLLCWVAGYCLVCPPAHAAAAAALITDERLFSLVTLAPAIIAVLCLLAFSFRDRGRPATADEERDVEWAPAIAPSLDDIRRTVDRG